MNPLLRNILVVVLGIIVAGVINSGIIALGASVVPVPEGVDPNDINSLKENVDLYSAKHFIVPFLAHALGTLVGAYLVARLAVSRFKMLALIVGGVFFLGGLAMAIMLPEFWVYSIIDLVFAYFPPAYLGWKLAKSPT